MTPGNPFVKYGSPVMSRTLGEEKGTSLSRTQYGVTSRAVLYSFKNTFRVTLRTRGRPIPEFTLVTHGQFEF